MEARIYESVDKAESDCDSEDDPFADIDELWMPNNHFSAWYNIIQPSTCVCVRII